MPLICCGTYLKRKWFITAIPLLLTGAGAVVQIPATSSALAGNNSQLSGTSFDLCTKEGVCSWLEIYQKAGKQKQEELIKSWMATPKNNPRALLEWARQGSVPAREVLATLWGRNSLSFQMRAAIVQTFVTLRLEEEFCKDLASGGHREVLIMAYWRFPFPKGTSFCWNYSIMIGDRWPQLLPGCAGSGSIEGTGSRIIGTLGSWKNWGSPRAFAIAEIWEPNPKIGGKELWRQTWVLGPTRLRFVPAPNQIAQHDQEADCSASVCAFTTLRIGSSAVYLKTNSP